MTRAEALEMVREAEKAIRGAVTVDTVPGRALAYQGAIACALVVIADVLLESDQPRERLGH